MKNENIYPEGATVYARHAPNLKLTVRRYVDRIYYCQVADEAPGKDLVYFERELMPDKDE